jgi:hypothetical protein
LGCGTGVLLGAIGLVWLASGLVDPPTDNRVTFVLFGLALLLPGTLLALPWSRIRNRPIWLALYFMLVGSVPPAVALILAVNTWSAIHGAGGWGRGLVAALSIVWAVQLPAIWSLRPPPT